MRSLFLLIAFVFYSSFSPASPKSDNVVDSNTHQSEHVVIPVVTFDQTVAAYERGDLELARTRFGQLARLGFAEPQFNYGVMLYRGEGGEQDREAGKVWLALSAQQSYEPAVQAISALGYEDANAIQALSEPVSEYRPSALFERYDPASVSDDTPTEPVEPGPDYQLEPVERIQPVYPEVAALNSAPGWVKLGGWVHADGRVTEVVVIESSPPDVFDEVSIDAFQKWRFNPSELPSREKPLFVTQHLDYQLGGHVSDLPRRHPISRRHREWLQAGEQDDLALLRAGLLERSYPLQRRISDEDYRALLFRMAKNNVPLAAAQLSGFCANDQECWQFWRKRAAFVGHPLSLFKLADREQVEPELAEHMMALAAEQGMDAAVLHRLRAVADGELALSDAQRAELMAAMLEHLRSKKQPLYEQLSTQSH